MHIGVFKGKPIRDFWRLNEVQMRHLMGS